MKEIYCSHNRDNPKPVAIYGLSPIDTFRLTETEAWELAKSLLSTLQGLNQKSYSIRVNA